MNVITSFAFKPILRSVKQLALGVGLGLLTFSCSSDDGFSEANQDAAKKYITQLALTNAGETQVTTISYDEAGRVMSVSDGIDAEYFAYDNQGNLEKMAGIGSTVMTGEILGKLFEAYEVGEVLQFDSKGNPTVIELYDVDYDGFPVTYTAELSYDDKPFSFYYTLDAAGIIEVLNDVRFQFMAPKKVMLAKQLLPVNNPVKAVINSSNDEIVGTFTVNYSYDTADYPTQASVLFDEAGYVEHYTVNYTYKK